MWGESVYPTYVMHDDWDSAGQFGMYTSAPPAPLPLPPMTDSDGLQLQQLHYQEPPGSGGQFGICTGTPPPLDHFPYDQNILDSSEWQLENPTLHQVAEPHYDPWAPLPLLHSPLSLGESEASEGPASVGSSCSTTDSGVELSAEDLQPAQQSLPDSLQLQQSESGNTRKRSLESPPPIRRLPVNRALIRNQGSDSYTLWYFLLKLLIEPYKRDVICWTGIGLEFRIIDRERLRELWATHNCRPRVQWDSIERTLRANAGRVIDRVMLPRQNRCQVPIFVFVTEPAYHLGWTPILLDEFITKYALPEFSSHSVRNGTAAPPPPAKKSRHNKTSKHPEATPPSTVPLPSLLDAFHSPLPTFSPFSQYSPPNLHVPFSSESH